MHEPRDHDTRLICPTHKSRLQCRPFLQQIVEAARHEPPLPDFPALDKTTGNFPLGNSFAKLYEQACTARKRDQEEGGADELGKLQGSNKNPGNQKSFLEICQLSDPAGRMIHWKGWLEPTPPPEPVPQPHPVYAFSQPVAVIDFATELECDCPTSGCKLADELRYRIGVGTVDCLGGSHCHCEDGKVEVQVKRWLPHSEVSDVHEEVPSALETPRKLADDGRQHAVGPYMWPIELLRPIDFSEWERLHEPPPKKRGRKAKGGDGGDGTSEVLRTLGRAEGVGVDTDEDDASYSTQSELPDPESDDEEHPTPEKKQKTKQKTKQTQKTSRATRSSARAQT